MNDNTICGSDDFNGIRWLQRKVQRRAALLPSEFSTLEEWELYKQRVRSELPGRIGIPELPALKESRIRGVVRTGERTMCERIDVYVDDNFSIPTFVFAPSESQSAPRPAILWNPGWPQSKYIPSYQKFAGRMAAQGFVVLIPDHIPFGETSYPDGKEGSSMTLAMGMGNVLGYSQLAVRAMETMRCGEYLRSREDVDENLVIVAGLCQGGQDTWLSAALDDGFCAAAPLCSASTFGVHFSEMALYRANADASPFPFGILDVCDVQHLHAMIAPRPLMVRINLGDDWWPVSGFADIERMTAAVYDLYGASSVLDMKGEIHEHDLTGPFADALEAFALRVVNGAK
jgi:hypothetical protein